MPLTNDNKLPEFRNLGDLNSYLKFEGCHRCGLGLQTNIRGCCVSRGSHLASKMIIGEAPGEDEDSQRKPFVGSAGKLLDRIWASVGWNTNDWYLTNTVLCRPVAPVGYGKRNMTPKASQKKSCNPFLWQQIQLVNPSIIVTLGAQATATMINKPLVKMGDYRGNLIRSGRFLLFPMLHPAAILHAQKNPETYELRKQQMWADIRNLKKIIDEEKL